jgi:hypothetical protein
MKICWNNRRKSSLFSVFDSRTITLIAIAILLPTLISSPFLISVSNSYVVYAQQSLSPSSSLTPSSQSSAAKVKIASPTKGQQVPAGKAIAISGTSADNATPSSSDCKVSVIVNKVRPYQPATPVGPGGADDYSKWNFVLTSKYTTIKPGQNRITARYECANNPSTTSFYRINVTGVQAVTQVSGTGSATSPAATIAPQIVKGTPNQAQQQTTPVNTLSQLPKQANSNENGTPIVLRLLSGGKCPQGYHLVSGAVCIKDLPSAAASTKTKTKTKTTTPTPAIPASTTSTTKSFSAPTPSITTSTSSTATRSVGIPTASIQWDPKLHPGAFEQVNERYLILKSNSIVHNPNFKFFSDNWYQETHGTVIVVKFTGRNANPPFVNVKLINVLNPKPGTRQTFSQLKIGNTITTLPLAPGDNNQRRHFLIPNDVAGGYYLLDLIPTFGGHTSAVYTGKIFVPATKTPAGSTVVRSNSKSTTKLIVTPPCPDGAQRLPNGTCPTTPCPDGAQRLPNGTCPTTPPPLCPDGSQPAADGSCPLPPPPPPPPTTTCPDGSQPAADGSCPLPPPPPPPPPTTCPDGSQPAADGSCPPSPYSWHGSTSLHSI